MYSLPAKIKILLILAKDLDKIEINLFWSIALFHLKNTVSLIYFVTDCLWKDMFDSNSPQTLSNLISVKHLIILWPFILFLPKIGAIKVEQMAEFFRTLYLPCDLFFMVAIWY